MLLLPHAPVICPSSPLLCVVIARAGNSPVGALAVRGHCERDNLPIVTLPAQAVNLPDIPVATRASNLPVIAIIVRGSMPVIARNMHGHCERGNSPVLAHTAHTN